MFSALAAALLTICFPFIRVTLVIYRKLVSYSVKCFVTTAGRIFEPYDAILSDDNSSETPFNTGLVCSMNFNGELCLKVVQQIFERNVFNSKLKNDLVRYPELKQTYCNYLGCRFWVDDPHFKIENHIYNQTLPVAVQTEEKVHEWFVNRKFHAGRSPWELVLVKGWPTSLLVFRMHHMMGDGKSICKLLMGCLGQKQVRMAEPKRFGRTIYSRIRLPYDLFLANKLSLDLLAKARRLPFWLTGEETTAPVYVGFSEKIQWEDVRGLARQMAVRPASIVHSVVGGALGKLNGKFQCPAEIPVAYILSRSDHPDVLCNRAEAVLGVLHTDETTTTCVERLLKFNQQYENATRGNLPICSTFPYAVYGSCPNFLRRKLKRVCPVGVSVTLSSIPFDEEGFSVGEHACTNFKMSVGSMQASVGISVIPHTYKGTLCYTVVANSNLLDEEETMDLAKLIFLEYNCLMNETGYKSGMSTFNE